MTEAKAPCYQCRDRDTACHDTCPKFQAYTAEKKRQKELERQEHLGDNYTRLAWGRDYEMLLANQHRSVRIKRWK